MQGRRFSRDIRESVSHAAKLGMDPLAIEAITGVSNQQIRRIISEEKHGDLTRNQDCGKRTRQRILKSEHLEVSNGGIMMAVCLFTKRAHLFLSS